MDRPLSIQETQLLRVVKEAIISSTKKKTAISSVKLGTIFQTNHKVIEKYLDQFVDEGHIVRIHDESRYPKVIYGLPE
ncbi:hypothetical protein ACFOU2_13615 [Bacillus songklensis]|uniref:Transcriptional regulator n=1 Tax=Bacillus songklensis TaxID=1069116 RepID=A0ABV8B3J3_9BACI